MARGVLARNLAIFSRPVHSVNANRNIFYPMVIKFLRRSLKRAI